VDVILVEPAFPLNQRQFARALHSVGARVIGIGERPKEALGDELRHWLHHYEQVSNVCHEPSLEKAVRWCMQHSNVQRLEATVEAHVMAAAKVRERLGIPGTSVRTAFLCRDKPAMKEALRKAGIPCAQSLGTASPEEARQFLQRVGFPLVLKPVDAAGAAGTYRVNNIMEFEQALKSTRLIDGATVALEEFIEGHEGFYDTISIAGEVVHEFMCHYYPNVLEAMRKRWISPQFISTNRIDTAPAYDDVKRMGRKVIEVLGVETSATHMEWFFGPKGLKFSEIGCRPPGVGCWDLHAAGNDLDIYREWATAIVHGRRSQQPTRNYSAGIVALRPDQDGLISHYSGVDMIQRSFGRWLIDSHMPSPGTSTQPVSGGFMANAWMRFKHPDYDELRKLLDTVGQAVKVHAR
jgi:carbamoylphosphate synthase large subunit